MLVHCGQTVGWIKMKLGMQAGLDPGHIVRWGPSSPSPKGAEPQFSAHICCGQMAVWIKVPLGRKVGLGPSDIALDGDTAPPPEKGGRAPNFRPCLLWPNGWMDQDTTWYRATPWPRPYLRLGPGHIVLDGDQLPTKKGHSPLPIFDPCLLWPNVWMDQDATWYGGGPRPRPHCSRWGPSSPPKNK